MRKGLLVLALLIVFALISTASAIGGPIRFNYNGWVDVTYISSDAGYNNEYGIFTPPSTFIKLGNIHDLPDPGHLFSDVSRCAPGVDVIAYIKTPEDDESGQSRTYLSNSPGPDGYDHVLITSQANSFLVAFEDSYENGIDDDTNDVVLEIACRQDPPIATPEFPTMALPVALIVGMFGAVLFIKSTKEN